MSESVIRLEHIQKNYGKSKVLLDVNLEIEKGCIYGLIGKNGSGKTTIFKVILGLTAFNGGNIHIGDEKDTLSQGRSKIGFYVGQNFFTYMTARENLEYYRVLKNVKDKSEIDRVLKLVGLDGVAKRKAGKFSLGMKQRLGIAMAMVGNPEIILLDEPMNGLDPQGIIDIRNIILDLNKNRNITFVISSHLLDELSKVATHYGFISDGRLIREISAEEIKKDGNTTTTVVTPDTVKLAVLLDSMKLQYEIKSSSEAVVFAQLDLEEFMPQAKEAGIEINSLTVNSESLENVYLNIMGNKENC